MLQVRNITKTYKNGNNTIVALDNVSIDFPDKGLVFVVGRSGSGKSTLLNILGGLDKADNGEIIVDGRSTKEFTNNDFDTYRNYQIGFIFQEFNLIDDISVKDNIALALKMQAKNHDVTTIDEALKLVNLEGLGYRSLKELSGGQKQRVAIARALVKNPSIILADEPTGALDSKTGYDLMSALKTLSLNKLVIVVTHDSEMANVFGDELVQLHDGHIIDHLIISPDYKKEVNEKIDENIIKISSGNKIVDKEMLESMLKKDTTNYLCLTNKPEMITIAKPEVYDKIFFKEDLSKKFISKPDRLGDIKKQEKSKKQKAKIELKECFKMAFNQFKKSKGKSLFLIIFTIIAFSILGSTYLINTVNNGNIIANTLHRNNLELGIIEKYDDNVKTLFTKDSLNAFNNLDDSSNYAISKEVNLHYTPSSALTYSPFEMGYFRGVVECDDISKLQLNVSYGQKNFNEDSLSNNEIIISDYAAFELRRTGYLGYDANHKYGIVRPKNIEEQINSEILINTKFYKIIGVFKTNFEDFLPLLVSQVTSSNENEQVSSLNALKSYYYAKIFVPNGFYKKFYLDNTSSTTQGSLAKQSFAFVANNIPLYTYDEENGTYSEDYTQFNFSYMNLVNLTTYEEVKNRPAMINAKIIWGELPNRALQGNEIIISYDKLRENGLTNEKLIDKAISSLNQSSIYKANGQDLSSIVYKDGFNIVAVVEPLNSINASEEHKNVYDSILFSKEYSDLILDTTYAFDQVLFTLSNSVSKNIHKINNFFKNGYKVLNINGRVPTDYIDFASIQSISLIVATVMFIFALLFMFNYVSSNIKKRKKEIGILRATGARGKDVVQIFSIEEGIIAFIVASFSIFIILYVCSFINQSLGDLSIGLNIINIGFIDILLIVSFIFVFFILSSLIPVMSIAKMKPIDAIRKI